MEDIILFNKSFKKIDDTYFSNYGGGPYQKTYKSYTFSPEKIIKDLVYNDIDVKTLLDVGCASGELVRDFRRLGIDAFGIENNKEILNKSVVPEYCCYMDMTNLSSFKDKSFDVIYTNSFMYLLPQQIIPVLKQFKRVGIKGVYLCCPFLESYSGISDLPKDPFRTFLAKESWWEKQFEEAGFIRLNKNIYAT